MMTEGSAPAVNATSTAIGYAIGISGLYTATIVAMFFGGEWLDGVSTTIACIPPALVSSVIFIIAAVLTTSYVPALIGAGFGVAVHAPLLGVYVEPGVMIGTQTLALLIGCSVGAGVVGLQSKSIQILLVVSALVFVALAGEYGARAGGWHRVNKLSDPVLIRELGTGDMQRHFLIGRYLADNRPDLLAMAATDSRESVRLHAIEWAAHSMPAETLSRLEAATAGDDAEAAAAVTALEAIRAERARLDANR